MTMRHHSQRSGERGAALVIAILVLAILTVIGIALMLITSTESRIAANEWSINRGYYSADSGIRWAAAQFHDPKTFMARPEFGTKAAPNFFGSVLFQMPSHRWSQTVGFVVGDDIQVNIVTPGRLTRRLCPGCKANEPGDQAQYFYSFEVRSTGSQNDAFLQYSKALVADIEAGPLPGKQGP
jgi:PilX N-terminal